MIPVRQTQFAARPGEGAGNCLAASLASVLELQLEDVPNFAAVMDFSEEPTDPVDGKGRTAWFAAVEEWLVEHGLGIVCYYADKPHWATLGSHVLAHGPSPRGDFLHTVVARYTEGRIEYVHDPHPSDEFLAGDPVEVWALVLR